MIERDKFPTEVYCICYSCEYTITKVTIDNEEHFINLKRNNGVSCRCGGIATLLLNNLYIEKLVETPNIIENFIDLDNSLKTLLEDFKTQLDEMNSNKYEFRFTNDFQESNI